MAQEHPVLGRNSADHIKQLSEIDDDVAKLLRSAGLAVKVLTESQSSEQGQDHDDFAERREAFTSNASQYFNILASIDVGLRQQINALDESDILPSEHTTRDSQPVSQNSTATSNIPSMNMGTPRQGTIRKGAITGGGLGSLDVGWLNSRNDNVGKEMEAELWEDAQLLVESAEVRTKAQNAGQQSYHDAALSSGDQQKSHESVGMDQS